MRKTLLLLISIALLMGCNKTTENSETVEDSTAILLPEVKSGAFYENVLNESNAVVLADKIIYDVILRNPDATDEWATERLQSLDLEALINVVFNAIYNGRLTPLNYKTEMPMSLDEVKQLEAEYARERIGKMQFVEEWYFDEKSLQFGKRITAIMLAYELYDLDGNPRGYKAGVMVRLDDLNAVADNE